MAVRRKPLTQGIAQSAGGFHSEYSLEESSLSSGQELAHKPFQVQQLYERRGERRLPSSTNLEQTGGEAALIAPPRLRLASTRH